MNNISTNKYLTKESMEKLKKELDFLLKDKRAEISKRLEESISQGDLSENAEYEEAKEAQLMNEQRIAEIEDTLSRAVIVEKNENTKSEIGLGSSVVLEKSADKTKFEYAIVASDEANLAEKKISTESPLGQALMGRKPGEKIEVVTPNGKMEYTIVKIA